MIWSARRELQPLDRLERGVLDDSAPLAGLLRHALIIGGHASSEPLKEWAGHELRGYVRAPDALPDYRRTFAPIRVDSRSPFWARGGETISALHLPEFARGAITEELTITNGVGELEDLVARARPGDVVKISLPGAAELRTFMTRSEQYRKHRVVIDELYWGVPPSSVQGILDQVRTRLTQFVAELRSTMPNGSHAPTPEQVHQAVQSIQITAGDNANVTVTAPVAYAGSGGTASAISGAQLGWWRRRRGLT
ncbi:hypothetical protein J7I97_25000 [Streptomyces sp. ISL-87]|uniref:AbiTii domain-containing protein n=1 Tax=Streptomyces sp. ISL-87 TaxID=2819188 RepID=UPI001BEB1A25|nr:hypothetical protein [Streptomyces sp. ISL-87]MBT2611426.1 hypothetical protein [Streptomyces sp. ISL-87]